MFDVSGGKIVVDYPKPDDRPAIHAALVPVLSPDAERGSWDRFLGSLSDRLQTSLEEESDATWRVALEESARLPDDDPRRPSDFLDEATLRMAEGPYDLVVVVTDVALVSRKIRVEPALASPIARVAAVSARSLVATPRGEPVRRLSDPDVSARAERLLQSVVRRLLGRDDLTHAAKRFPEDELRGGGPLRVAAFHLTSAVRHAPLVARTVWRNRAPFLSLSLPTLATAAVAPALILVFTAEIWDVGFGIGDRVAAAFAAMSVIAATVYLANVQNLFFPRRERRVVNEHLAVVNVTVLLTLFLMMIGLFLMVGGLMYAIQTLVFPPGLMETWPTLEVAGIGVADHLRLATFISTVAVTTGALGGGLESRTLLRHLALFSASP